MVREIGRQYVEKRIAAIKNGDETLDDIMTSAIRENGEDTMCMCVLLEIHMHAHYSHLLP